MRKQEVLAQLEQDWRQLLAWSPAEIPPLPVSLSEVARRPPSAIELFAEIEDVRMEWRELAAPELGRKLGPLAGRLITPQWTLKDLVSHLASWAREFRSEAETVAQGAQFEYQIPCTPRVGPTAWNHAEVEKRRAQTLAGALQEIDTESRRLQDVVLALPAAQLVATADFPAMMMEEPPRPVWRSIVECVMMKCGHERHHLARIHAWLAQQQQ